MNYFYGKKTKIIATVGPASRNEETLEAMINEGVDVFRINASHSRAPEDIVETVLLIRKVSHSIGKYTAILVDLQGPKIRVGCIEDGRVNLVKGAQFLLVEEEVLGNAERVSVTPEALASLAVGDDVFIDDGKIKLEVKSLVEGGVLCEVLVSGVLSDKKGVNMPSSSLNNLSPLTKKDRRDVDAVLPHNVDYLALSFVSSSEDVRNFKMYLKDRGGASIKVISKIERQLAVDDVSAIVQESDAIMVARGDLGVEVGVEKVPRIQKMIINEANKYIKTVIVATQMLESMVVSKTATRAEVSDVANAIYDRCDAVMLSSETATGIDPVNVVRVMADICQATDNHIRELSSDKILEPNFVKKTVTVSFCQAAEQVAREHNAKAIMAFTSSGNTPLIVSKLYSIFPIIAPTDNQEVCTKMSLFRGVVPIMMTTPFSQILLWSEMIEIAVSVSKKRNLLSKGDVVLVTAGLPIGKTNGINSIRIITV